MPANPPRSAREWEWQGIEDALKKVKEAKRQIEEQVSSFQAWVLNGSVQPAPGGGSW